MKIIFDSSLLLSMPEVSMVTDHPWKDIATTPYAICVKRVVVTLLGVEVEEQELSVSAFKSIFKFFYHSLPTCILGKIFSY